MIVISSAVLNSFPFFADLNQEQLESLASLAHEVSLQHGDSVFHENRMARMLYLLVDGWVDIMINTNTQDARQEVVTTLIPGDIFGWSAVVEPYVYTTSAVCASPVRAIGFKGVELRALFETDHQLCCVLTSRLCQVIASRLRATRLQLVSIYVIN